MADQFQEQYQEFPDVAHCLCHSPSTSKRQDCSQTSSQTQTSLILLSEHMDALLQDNIAQQSHDSIWGKVVAR
jgi:hypothetical protein